MLGDMPSSSPSSFSEKRRSLRARRYRKAQCIFNDGSSSFDVTLRDISPTGARIAAGDLLRLPPSFELRIYDSDGGYSARKARIVWSRGAAAGIEFID
jgi:hypothetical protein